MKLHEIKLFEEPVETVSAEGLWAQNGDAAATYAPAVIYYVRPVENSSSEFEVLYDDQGGRKPYAIMDKEDLEAAFAPIRPNQKPDAEGFLTYRSNDLYDAFKYGGDPVKLTLAANAAGEPEGATVKLNKGDYLLRQDDGDEFIYTVERANYFDNKYTKKA